MINSRAAGEDDIERATVFGGGVTGRATADFLHGLGAKVFLTDNSRLKSETKKFLRDRNITFEENGHSSKVLRSPLIVLSPGVDPDLDILKKARREGKTVIGEIELAYRFCEAETIVAITGTNGKTTTTLMLEKILKHNGLSALSCGNIGKPFIGQLSEIGAEKRVIVETSSYQLQTIEKFRPEVGVLLNLAPDHLHRHGNFENYRSAKLRIFENQREKDFSLINEKLGLTPDNRRPKVVTFSEKEVPFKYPAEHNRENLAAAVKAASLLPGTKNLKIELPPELKDGSISIPHRLEFAGKVKGRVFYNDSKATNPDSTAAALEWAPKSTWLLLGGMAKEKGYEELAEKIRRKSPKGIVFFGKDGKKLKDIISARQKGREERIGVFPDLEKTLSFVYEKSDPGDMILLSPACASFDSYQNFEKRGEDFKEIVKRLKNSGTA